MKVYNISSTNGNNFKAGVKIRGSENIGHKYLYNEIIRVTNEYKIPANFKTSEIELPSVSKTVIAKLNELGIKFSNK